MVFGFTVEQRLMKSFNSSKVFAMVFIFRLLDLKGQHVLNS